MAFAIGGVLFFILGWFLGSRRAPIASDNRLEAELRQQVNQRETELNQVRDQLSGANSSRAAAEAKQNAAEKLLGEQRALQEKTLQETKELQAKAITDLRDTFKALSA